MKKNIFFVLFILFILIHNTISYCDYGSEVSGIDIKEKELRMKILNDPMDAELHFELADILIDLGNYKEALVESNKALEIDSANPYYLLNRAVIYMHLDNEEEAVKDLNKIIEINPEITSAYMNLSSIYKNKGDYDKAIEYCERALKIRKDEDFYYHLATIYEVMGKYEKARAYYEWTISSDRFNSQFSKIAKEKIEEIDKILAEKKG